MVATCVVFAEMKLLLMLLEIEEDSIVRWPFETVAVGIADLTEIFRG
jgi:hypothetical protein